MENLYKKGYKTFKIHNEGKYSPDIKLITRQEFFEKIKKHVAIEEPMLDVGGFEGRMGRTTFGRYSNYNILDIKQPKEHWKKTNTFYKSDILNCPEIKDNSFKLVFSLSLLEHVKNPFKAAAEMYRICQKDGYVALMAPFSWRYHPCPEDYFRFTHKGIEQLFDNKLDIIMSGYEATYRRKNSKGHYGNSRDKVPLDELGGWRENWQIIFLGKK